MAYLGLTGGVASGKSTVGADVRGPRRKNYHCRRDRSRTLARSASGLSGDRSPLRPDQFSTPSETSIANAWARSFFLPRHARRAQHHSPSRIIEASRNSQTQYELTDPAHVVLVDAALIFEAGIGGRFQKVIVVWCRPEQQVDRLMAKTGLTREEAERRIAAQISPEEKRRRADFPIDNSASIENTRRQVEEIYPQLQRLAPSRS